MASCFAQQSAECPLLRLLRKAINLLANGITELCRCIRSVFRRRSRKGRCFSAEEVERKVMRLAGKRRSRLAKEVRTFIEAMRRRPLRQPDGDWKQAFIDTRSQMTATKHYLAQKLGTGDSEEEEDALERCVQRLLFEPLHNELYQRAMLGLFMERCVYEMRQLVRRHNRVGVPPSRLGAPTLSPESTERVRSELYTMQSARLPCDKIHHLISATEHASRMVQEENGIIVNSDNLVPLMSWILIDTGMIYAIIEAELMLAMLTPEKERGKPGFYLTILYIACTCVHTRPDPPSRPAASAAIAPTLKNTCDAATVAAHGNTSDEAAEVGGGSGADDTTCDEISPAVRIPSDDDVQKPERDVDSIEEASEGYCSDPDRDCSPEPVEIVKIDTTDRDSCFGDDELSFQSKSSLSSWSSNVDLDSLSTGNDSGIWCVCRSVSNLSTHSSDESLHDSECVNSRTTQLHSAGTLFSAVPMLLPRALMA